MPPLIFKKGLDLKHEVAPVLDGSYGSSLVATVKESQYQYRSGRLLVHLAREFGFCYGVERAVDYAYQTRRKFPERRVVLLGEIIHNPHVNAKLRQMGVEILAPGPDGFPFDAIGADDVVIIPAFGVTIAPPNRVSDNFPTPGDAGLLSALERACDRVGAKHRRMASGAGHDTAWIARVAPAAMIFVPCKEGRSHSADEWAENDDIALGAAVLFEAVREMDRNQEKVDGTHTG